MDISSQLAGFCVTFAVGYAGYVVFRRLKVPNPGLLGSMFFTGMMNVMGYYPYFTIGTVSFASNMLIGVMLGRQINRNGIKRIRGILKFVVLQTIGILILSLIVGMVLYKLAGLALPTALLSGTAGGISEMSAFGISINADAVVIALIQLFRVVIFLTIIPYLSMLVRRLGIGKATGSSVTVPAPSTIFFARGDYLTLAVTAFGGAWTFQRLGVPTGAMIGAMIACGACVIYLGRSYKYNINIRYVAQVGLGMIMGQRVNARTFTLLTELMLPVLVATTVMLTGCVLMAIFLHWMSGWDFFLCLLCSAPAGLSQITAFAEEIGADSLTISIFHSVRIISIVSIYPFIIMSVM
jgi:membrane AbrB-like protein